MLSETAQPVPELPGDLLAIHDELAKSETEALKLVEKLSDAEINWQPEAGKTWSIGQCIDHIVRSNDLHIQVMRSAVRRVHAAEKPRRGPLHATWFERYFIKAMDAPPRQKFRTSPKVLPAEFQPAEEIIAYLCRSHQEMRALIVESSGMNLNRIRFRSPFVWWLRMTVGTGLLFLNAHERRHLWQATQVRSLIEAGASVERIRTSNCEPE